MFKSLVATLVVFLFGNLPSVPAPVVFQRIEEPPTTVEMPIVEKGGADDFKCSCVAYVRSKAKYQPPLVATAAEISATKETPHTGGWLLWKATKASPNGHVSYIEEIVNNKMRISEHNFEICKTTERWVDINNALIKGYVY